MKLLACLVISVGLLALFGLAAVKAFQASPFVQAHSVHVAAGLAGLGLLLCLLAKGSGDAHEGKGGALRFLGRVYYWGPMFVLFAGIMAGQPYLPRALSHPAIKDQFAGVSQVFKSSLAKVGGKAKAAPASALKLQGIFYRRPPSAILNGQLLYVGDSLGTAKVLAIEQYGVTVEQGGQKRLLLVGK